MIASLVSAVSLTAAVLAGPVPVVPCGGDADCAARNPGISTYGTPEEDEPGWSCSTMGNRLCGPSFDVNGIVGVYRVPTGELIVWSNRAAQFVPMPEGWVSVYQGQPGEDPTVIEPDSLN